MYPHLAYRHEWIIIRVIRILAQQEVVVVLILLNTENLVHVLHCI